MGDMPLGPPPGRKGTILRVGTEPVVDWYGDPERGDRPRFEVLMSGWVIKEAEYGQYIEIGPGGRIAGTPDALDYDPETQIWIGGYTIAELREISHKERTPMKKVKKFLDYWIFDPLRWAWDRLRYNSFRG